MSTRRSKIILSQTPETSSEPSGLLGPGEPSARAFGEGLRRFALGLASALIVARAYWPAEYRAEEDSGGGLEWSLAMLVVAAIGSLSMWLCGGLKLRRSWADLGVLVLVGLVAISASHAAERRIAINFAWEWVGVGIAYFAIRNLPKSRAESNAIAAALVATAVAVSFYGRYQVDVEHPQMRAAYVKNPRVFLAQVGIDPNAKPGDPERKRFEDRLLGSREPVAAFALANTLAGYLVGPSVVALTLFLRAFRRKETRTLWPLLLFGVPLLLMLSCLLLTKSRSAYLGLLFAAILLAWRERAHFPARKILIASIFVVAAVAGLAAIAAASGHLDKKVLTESTKSLTYRVEYWRGAWGMITDGRLRWLTGVGPGNFGGPYLQHKLPQASEEISDPHNFLLEVWATAGLPALIAIVISLIVGLRASFGPSSNPEDADDPSNEPQPVAKWLVFVGGLGGFSLVMTLGRLNPFSGDDFSRLVILAAGWSLAVLLGASLWKRVPLTSDALGLGVVAIVINLLAAGGVGFAPVSLMMWGLLALALNLREDRACSQRRDVGDRGLSFVVMAIVAAAIGTYIGTVLPFWRAQSAMSEAETALTSVIADPKRADAAYLRAIMVDVYGSRSRIARAFLEYREWQRRGSPPEDFTWHRIDSGLLSALKPPLNPDNLAVQRLRAKIAREFLDLPNLIPAERLRIRNDRLDASRAACNLYPADATLRADLAEAYADLNKFPEALDEGRLALELDAANPHKDKKLRDVQRKRLESAMETWKAM